MKYLPLVATAIFTLTMTLALPAADNIGVGAKPVKGADIILDGSRKMLNEKWTYWKEKMTGGNMS